MNEVKELLIHLNSNGIQLDMVDGKLKSKSLTNALTVETISLIKENKERICDYLVAKDILRADKITRHHNRDSEFVASFAQQRLWFINALQGGTPEYNMQMVFNVSGSLDLSLLKKVFTTILIRHETLRTVYREQDGRTLQNIIPPEKIDFEVAIYDVEHLDSGSQPLEIRKLIESDLLRSFDLSADVMLRVSYIKKTGNSGVLMLNVHHIASDGWSLEILTKEFFVVYHAYIHGLESNLPTLKIQYADFAQWQNTYLKGDVLERKVAYWDKQLANVPALHSLPLDYDRPKIKQHVGALLMHQLPGETAKRLLAFSKRCQITPFMLLHACLSLVLARNSNNNDIVIGIPIANRLQEELEPLIGLFANTVVLRVDTSNRTLADFFEHVKKVHLDAQANQDIPFEKVVERLNLPRSLQYSPLVQILLTTDTSYGVNDRDAAKAYSFSDVEVSEVNPELVQIMFDLEIKLSISELGVRLNWLYDISLFNEARIEALNAQLCRLLGYLTSVDSPLNQYLRALPILSETETRDLLYKFNSTHVNYPKECFIHELFEQQAKHNPEHTAVVFENTRLSYRQLDERSNQLAHYLRDCHGVQPDMLVGLCIERSVEMVIGIMGILKAGGAYVPLDPSYPQERLNHIFSDANLTVLLTSKRQHHLVDAFQDRAVFLDGIGAQQSNSHISDKYSMKQVTGVPPVLEPGHLAYVIYTSGSTGQPKGVMIEHRALFNRIYWMNKQYGLCSHDKVLQKTPYSFDVSVWEFLWTLGYGATLVVAKPDGHKDPAYLCSLIQTENVTKLHFVPSMLDAMLQHKAFMDCLSIQQTFCSGEELHANQVLGFREKLPDAQLHNLYGPTEAAIDVSYWDCSGDIAQGVPIGKPIDNIQLIIMDNTVQPVPDGVVGELYIGGDGLARGYLNREELTATTFVENPHYDNQHPNSSKCLYRTGDLVRRLADGNIEFIGRADNQVKIRGVRIELGEIEFKLNQQASVHSALVMVKKIAGANQLVAYCKSNMPLNESHVGQYIDDLRSALHGTLPDYMIPAAFVIIDAWPITLNGKIDKTRLPEPETRFSLNEHILPKTEAEKILARIWSDLLNVDLEKISATSNYFELGGQSLLSMRLVSQIHQIMGVELSLQQVFDAPDLQDMASLLSSMSKSPERVRLQPVPREKNRHMTSFSQEDLWRIDSQRQNGTPEYNRPHAYRINGQLDLALISDVFRAILQRHEILRTIYLEGEGNVLQYIKNIEEFEFNIFEHDLTHLNSATQPDDLAHFLAAEIERPFNLSCDLPFRVSYVKLAQNEGILLFNAHQIVWDGWSVEVLTKEFFVLCQAFYAGEKNPLPPLEIQFADFAHWQRSRFQNIALDLMFSYWQTHLHNMPQFHSLPLDKVRPEHKQFNGAILISRLSIGTANDLLGLAQSYKLSPFMLLHCALLIFLSRQSKTNDIVVGTPVANRLQDELEPLIGFISNFLVLRANTDHQTLAELFAHVRQVHFDAQANQDFPFELLVEKLNTPRSKAHTPLFQIMMSSKTKFNLSGTGPAPEYGLPEVVIDKYDLGLARADYDLQVDLHIYDEGVRLKWVYDVNLFEFSTISNFNDQLTHVLNNLAKVSSAESVFLEEI